MYLGAQGTFNPIPPFCCSSVSTAHAAGGASASGEGGALLGEGVGAVCEVNIGGGVVLPVLSAGPGDEEELYG